MQTVAFFKLTLLITVCSWGMLVQMRGATFNNNDGEVYICFRRANPVSVPPGADLGGTNLVVDAGPISIFTNLAPNTKLTIVNYTGGQLGQVGTNNVGWSAFAYFSASPAAGTIFITSPRSVLNTQTASNLCVTAKVNGNIIGQMGAVPSGALDSFNFGFSPLNTGNAVLESASYLNNSAGSSSYTLAVGPSIDFNGTFSSSFEKYTPASFTTAGTPVRADFYWSYPVASIHTVAYASFLGYFELETNGVMTYTAYPPATVTTPVITSFSRTNNISYVSFTTGSSGIYTLRGTNSSGLSVARTNWPAISSVSGNSFVNTLTDINSNPNNFYVITAQ